MSADAPLCSVCIANYNGMAVLDACLKSVLSQNCSFPVEVIVHDDASTDGSVNLIRRNYPAVKLITSPQNVGFCVSNNRMVAEARGQYILLLNNDAMLMPEALQCLFEESAALEVAAVLGLPQYDAETGELIDRGSLFDPFLNAVPNSEVDKAAVGMVIGACLWLPRELWDEIGGFPSWFGSLAEDAYLCCVARLWGYPVRVVGQSGFRHWVGVSLGGGRVRDGRLVTTRERRAQTERNKTFVMAICYPALLLMVLLPLHFALMLVEGAALSLARWDASLWKDIYAPLLSTFWGERERLRGERRRIQERRRIGVREFLEPFRWQPWKLRLLFRYGLPRVH